MAHIVIAAAFLADVVLKMLARELPDTLGRFSFASPAGVIGFAPSTNIVLAFSLPVPNAWIWPVGWVVVLALIGALGRISNFKFQISNSVSTALLAIILGAVSNLFDRTFLGGVTDYLSFTNQFPAFNIADLLVLGGVVYWLLFERSSHRARRVERSETAGP